MGLRAAGSVPQCKYVEEGIYRQGKGLKMQKV